MCLTSKDKATTPYTGQVENGEIVYINCELTCPMCHMPQGQEKCIPRKSYSIVADATLCSSDCVKNERAKHGEGGYVCKSKKTNAYFLGSEGSMCKKTPKSTSAISDAEECKKAIKQLGLKENNFDGDADDNHPPGCSLKYVVGDKMDQVDVYHHKNMDTGAGSSDVKPVCKNSENDSFKTYTMLPRAKCQTSETKFDDDQGNDPGWGVGELTGEECMGKCDTARDKHERACVAFEHRSEDFKAKAECELMWGCESVIQTTGSKKIQTYMKTPDEDQPPANGIGLVKGRVGPDQKCEIPAYIASADCKDQPIFAQQKCTLSLAKCPDHDAKLYQCHTNGHWILVPELIVDINEAEVAVGDEINLHPGSQQSLEADDAILDFKSLKCPGESVEAFVHVAVSKDALSSQWTRQLFLWFSLLVVSFWFLSRFLSSREKGDKLELLLSTDEPHEFRRGAGIEL